MHYFLLLILLLVLVGVLYLQHDRFGATAKGGRLIRMEAAPNYRNGAFENLEHTPSFAEGTGFSDVLKTFFGKDKRNVPDHEIPVIRTDLHALPASGNYYVWFGHSSYLLRLDGKTILVDPVFSKYATPVRVSIRAFDSEYTYTVEDMPEIDLLVITHDHWDHLDYNTFMKLQSKVRHIVTGLGVGAHLEKWGFPASRITELYWREHTNVDGLQITSTTARHFSGRKFKRNNTLWSSFVLEGPKKIFIGGDSGYGRHFEEIGREYGPFDYAILENGQYNAMWPYIHLLPEEVIRVAEDLKAVHTIPVHSSKFPLANHAWDEPLSRVTAEAVRRDAKLVTPKIGQVVSLDEYQELPRWWEEVPR